MDSELAAKAVSHLMELWINPEIERRRERGILPANFRLWAAQVIFTSPQDKASRLVLLNNEIRIEMRLKIEKEVQLRDQISLNEALAIEDVRLPASEPNSAHITLLLFKGSWYLWFDAIYNKARVRSHLEAIREFIDVAKFALRDKKLRPAADLLFSSAELLAKAELMKHPDNQLDSHRAVQRKFNSWVKLGNAPIESANNLNTLAGMRDSARYLKGNIKLSEPKLQKILAYLELDVERLECITNYKLKADNSSKTP